MPQENVELIERFFETLARRDIDGWLECFHPTIEFVLPRNLLEGGSYRGLDGVRRAWADIFEAWDDYRYEQADIRARGDQVVSLGLATNVGKAGGPSVEYEAAYVAQVQEGKVVRFRPFLSHAEALKAMGLEEEPMSENLDLVRSIYAAWERGDFSSAEWAHPEIEFVFADGPSPRTWHGLDGMAAGWRDWLSAWRDVSVETEGWRELDQERVMVLIHASGRGKTSGLEVGDIWRKGVSVFHVDDHKVTRLVIYLDRDRALADLGLEE